MAQSEKDQAVGVLRTGKRKALAINPLVAARYRDRHSVSRKESDPGDALALANVLCTDMHPHRPLPEDSDLGRASAVLARAQQDSLWNREPATACQPAAFPPAGVLPGRLGGLRTLAHRLVPSRGPGAPRSRPDADPRGGVHAHTADGRIPKGRPQASH